MARDLTAQNTTVETASVEIKVLTVSGTQFTPAHFRQLKDEPLIDQETVTLNGVPWGIVNSFTGECAKADPHLHVVWQKGDELRRCCVWPDHERARRWYLMRRAVKPWLVAAIFTQLAEHCDDHGLRVTWDIEGQAVEAIRMKAGGRWLELLPIVLSGKEQTILQHRLDASYGHDSANDASASRMNEFLRERAYEWGGRSDPTHIRSRLEEEAVKMTEFERRWREQYAALEALDHLFIGV